MDSLTVKLMSLAVHAEEFMETGYFGDAVAIQSLLADPEVAAKRAELDAMAMLPVKRAGGSE
jgi:hypothetical protein